MPHCNFFLTYSTWVFHFIPTLASPKERFYCFFSIVLGGMCSLTLSFSLSLSGCRWRNVKVLKNALIDIVYLSFFGCLPSSISWCTNSADFLKMMTELLYLFWQGWKQQLLINVLPFMCLIAMLQCYFRQVSTLGEAGT